MTLLRTLVVKDFRDFYLSLSDIAMDVVALSLMLGVYWYTGQAFSPALSETELGAGGYFSYILIGHVGLILPFSLALGTAASVRRLAGEGTLALVLSEPVAPARFFSLCALAQLPREGLRAGLLLLAAYVLFDFSIPPARLMGALVLVLVSLPAFLGIGLFLTALWIGTGRGASAAESLGGFLNVLAGAYFPLAVLPLEARRLAELSPFTLYLQCLRRWLAGGWEPTLASSLGVLGVSGFVFLALGHAALRLGLVSIRRNGMATLNGR